MRARWLPLATMFLPSLGACNSCARRGTPSHAVDSDAVSAAPSGAAASSPSAAASGAHTSAVAEWRRCARSEVLAGKCAPHVVSPAVGDLTAIACSDDAVYMKRHAEATVQALRIDDGTVLGTVSAERVLWLGLAGETLIGVAPATPTSKSTIQTAPVSTMAFSEAWTSDQSVGQVQFGGYGAAWLMVTTAGAQLWAMAPGSAAAAVPGLRVKRGVAFTVTDDRILVIDGEWALNVIGPTGAAPPIEVFPVPKGRTVSGPLSCSRDVCVFGHHPPPEDPIPGQPILDRDGSLYVINRRTGKATVLSPTGGVRWVHTSSGIAAWIAAAGDEGPLVANSVDPPSSPATLAGGVRWRSTCAASKTLIYQDATGAIAALPLNAP